MKNIDLVHSATQILKQCSPKIKDEKITIFCGESSQHTGQLIYQAAKTISKNVLLLQMDLSSLFRNQKPEPLNYLINDSGLIVITDKNITPQKLKRAFTNEPEAHVLCINAPNEQTMNRWMMANHPRIALRTHKIADIFSIGRRMKLNTPDGTALDMSIQSSVIVADAPMINGSGHICLLPSGEVKIFPDPESINGKMAVNFLAGTTNQNDPATLIVKNGLVHQIRGKSMTAALLRKQLKRCKPQYRKIVNFSIGTNDTASFGNSHFEDQKVLGSACVFIGEKAEVKPMLTSGVMLSPSIYIDGRKILEKGYLALN
ncbi:MAG: hypothetical protein DWQ05_12225 [Calditrichaeota bacterium]|nr:MAG: hypothetical protein DWQ05_12225 [Calditrichota bacterium]